jgi:hypothetical protein
MAQRSPTELYHELRNEFTFLRATLDGAIAELRSAELLQVRERLAVLEHRLEELGAIKEDNKKLAVVENQLGDLRRWQEESGRRLFQFVLLFLGGIVTLAINLAVTFLRK